MEQGFAVGLKIFSNVIDFFVVVIMRRIIKLLRPSFSAVIVIYLCFLFSCFVVAMYDLLHRITASRLISY